MASSRFCGGCASDDMKKSLNVMIVVLVIETFTGRLCKGSHAYCLGCISRIEMVPKLAN